MRFVWPLTWLCLSLVLASCGQKPSVPPPVPPAPAPPAATSIPGWPATNALPRLATLKLQVGNQVVTAELCRRPLEIMTGMMFRTNMLEEEGMLFALAYPDRASFYMKNVVVPLSIAYMDVNGKILELHDMEPFNETPVYSYNLNIQYVLEMKQGWFARHGVLPGMIVTTEQGPIKGTVKFIPEYGKEKEK